MASRDAQDSMLSTDRAFVVHLAPAGGRGRRRFIGRVEHLSSGESVRFTSLEALLAFLAVDRADPPPAREQCTPAAPRRSTARALVAGEFCPIGPERPGDAIEAQDTLTDHKETPQ